MPAKRALSAALALLLIAAIPARATGVPTITVVDAINPGVGSSGAMDSSNSVALDGWLYFAANAFEFGDELWRTNGAVTELVKDIREAGDSRPDYLTVFGDLIYFTAYDETNGLELWRTDGTTAETEIVLDIRSGGADSSPEDLTVIGDWLYFSANDGTGAEPWRTNGTVTERVANINSSGDGGGYGFAGLGEYVYFMANDGSNGWELWRTNGTDTSIVENINPTGDAWPSSMTAFNGYLYFGADDGTNGNELWRTDGTEAGTTLVKDIRSGGRSYPENFTALGGYLYFGADDGTSGRELWRTNGTDTVMFADINTTGSSTPSDYSTFTEFNGYLYFDANDGESGAELWRTNGTTTARVADINQNTSAGSYPWAYVPLGDWLYFIASDGVTFGDAQLWRTNGTDTEMVPFPDANQGIECDCYDSIVAAGGRLFTTVYSSTVGHEFAYLDEPTYVLPETNRGASVWTTTLVILAGLTAAASIGLRVRGAKRA
jgi:ELWxxDGT repeat protein